MVEHRGFRDFTTTIQLLFKCPCRNTVYPRLKLFKSHYVLGPSEAEWETTKDVCDRLELFYNVTELFSGQDIPLPICFFL